MIKNNISLYFFISIFSFLSLVFINTSSKVFAEQLVDTDPGAKQQVCIDFKNNLRRGSIDTLTNGEVSLLQEFLQNKGHLSSEPTGYFGRLTVEAVWAFQSSVGFSPTGYFGPLTREKIKELTCGDSIKPSREITITSPNGGEKWMSGILNTITWTPYGYNPDINPAKDVSAYLEYKDNRNGRFITVGKVEESGKASIHWITGELDSASWGGRYAEPGQYYVLVVNNVTGATDRSDLPFTLLPKAVDLKIDGSDGPIAMTGGQSVKVSWESSGDVTTCQFDGLSDHSFSEVFSGNGSMQAVYGGSGDIDIQCVVDGQQVRDYVASSVPIVKSNVTILWPNGNEMIQLNQPITISWSQVGLQSLSIALYKNDQWQQWITKDLPLKNTGNIGQYVWTPTDTELTNSGNVFKLYVTGRMFNGYGYVDDKSDTTFSFFVNQASTPTAPTCSITASKENVMVDETFRLTWASDASYMTGLPTEITWPANGSQDMSSGTSGAKTYTLTFYGQNGLTTTCSKTITAIWQTPLPTAPIPLPTLKFTAKPTTITAGQQTTLSWESNANGYCEMFGGKINIKGTSSETPTSTTKYVITCHNRDGGLVTKSVTVTVEPIPLPTLKFTAKPTTITAGQQTTLSWESNANGYCEMFGGKINIKGTSSETPTSTTKYVITCHNRDGGLVTKSVTVTVSSYVNQGAAVINSQQPNLEEGTAVPSAQVNPRGKFTEDLYRGVTGKEVFTLQEVLTNAGFFSGEISGNFYDHTAEAVKEFQVKYGINSTGYVGQTTRAKLNELYGL